MVDPPDISLHPLPRPHNLFPWLWQKDGLDIIPHHADQLRYQLCGINDMEVSFTIVYYHRLAGPWGQTKAARSKQN